MAQELAFIPENFGQLSSVLAQVHYDPDDLGAGVQESFAVISYRGGKWRIRYRGEETILKEDNLEIVLVKAAKAVSKLYYEGGYNPSIERRKPDCWSSNSVNPDKEVPKPVSKACASCPNNVIGSHTVGTKRMKACTDNRRLAVVPMGDIPNELYGGGPMMLRVPAGSLSGLKGYGDKLNAFKYVYFGVGTRISFDQEAEYPKLVFGAIRPLNDNEAKAILLLRDDERVHRILNEDVDAISTEELAPIKEGLFEQPPKAAAPAPQAPPSRPIPTSSIADAMNSPAPRVVAKTEAPPPPPVPSQTVAPPPPPTQFKPALKVVPSEEIGGVLSENEASKALDDALAGLLNP